MIKSLRWRLQIWYTVLLLVVTASFGSILFYRANRTRWQEIDTQLESAARYLDVHLRRFPPWYFEESSEGSVKAGKLSKLVDELALPHELDLTKPPSDVERPYFVIFYANGKLLKGTSLPRKVQLFDIQSDSLSSRPELRYFDQGAYREAWMRGPCNSVIVVGKSLTMELQAMRSLGWQIAGTGLAVMFIGLAGGYSIASRIFRPLEGMAATAAAISERNLSQRIDERRLDTELQQLAQVLNSAFERLETAFQRQQQFTADASHELRTPLAILRSHVELALTQPLGPEDQRQCMEACMRAVTRMSSLVQGLLTLARTDAGIQDGQHRRIPFDALVNDCLVLLHSFAEEKNVQVLATLASVEVMGQIESLEKVVTNLLVNAIQYNRPGGTVNLELSQTDTEAILKIRDTGQGIDEKDQPHIFERFYRVDKARSRVSGGTGLGLAICKAIIEEHDGRIEFESRVGEGTTFIVHVPKAR